MDLAWIREAMQLEAAVDPRESMNMSDVPMRWVPTEFMLADVLTNIMDLQATGPVHEVGFRRAAHPARHACPGRGAG